MKPSRLALLATLLVLPIFSTTLSGCTKTVQVPVAVPQAKCPLPDRVPPPSLDAKPDSSNSYVQIPWEQAVALGKYIGSAERWMDLAGVCLDTRETPEVLRAAPPSPKAVVVDLLKAATPSRVNVTITWETCDEVNAYYYPVTKRVVLCDELLEFDLGAVKFIAAHELAHAVIMQRGVPYTGLHEAAADELAMVMLWRHSNWTVELNQAVDFWAGLSDDWFHGSDIHPRNDQRAWAIRRFLRLKSERWRIVYHWGQLLANH